MLWAVDHSTGNAAPETLDAEILAPLVEHEVSRRGISESWKQCAMYRIDRDGQAPPRVLTQSELDAAREPLAELLAFAQDLRHFDEAFPRDDVSGSRYPKR